MHTKMETQKKWSQLNSILKNHSIYPRRKGVCEQWLYNNVAPNPILTPSEGPLEFTHKTKHKQNGPNWPQFIKTIAFIPLEGGLRKMVLK